MPATLSRLGPIPQSPPSDPTPPNRYITRNPTFWASFFASTLRSNVANGTFERRQAGPHRRNGSASR